MASTSSSHVSNANITVLLQALATPGAGFGVVTHLVDEAQGTGNPLNGGARFQDFASTTEGAAAVVAGEISAEVQLAITAAFSQDLQPASFRVCRVDTGGGESYSDALTLLEAEGLTDLWMLTMDTRVTATQLLLAATVEALGNQYFLLLQASDADWKTAGIAAAMTAAAAYKYSGVVYHDVATTWADVALAVRNLAFDPDETSIAWEKNVSSVVLYSAFVTATQRTNMLANSIAVLGTWGSSDFWYDGVVSFEGRPLKELLTSAWYAARVSEAIQTLHQRESVAGRVVLVSASGMEQTRAAVESVNATGIAANHFNPGQVVTTPQPITAADITARRLRIVVEAQVGTGARVFNVTANLSQTEVVATA